MSLETVNTEHLDVAGVRYAYRRLGPSTGTPLVLLQHFTGTMDAWDPAVVNALAETRPVIVFNNRGIGTSSGQTPDTVEQMAADAETFIRGLGLAQVDLLGFSLGGMLAQVLAVRHPALIRKVIIAGAAPRGGEEHLLVVVEDAFAKAAPDVRLPLLFTSSDESQRAGRAFVARATARAQDRDPDSGDDVSEPQAKAIIGWCAVKDEGNKTLRGIVQPTLIVHGSDDTMFPSINAYNMFKAMKNAQLILYPDSGHGALFQYPETFVAHCRIFLDA
ncbi:alpha/beta fold hydrolase [Rhizobium leguminosarum]|uniref:Alpha/beta hydrolase family protein n=1 Tax=Rhizobium leguminosarum TaxID=384 RepID=A0A2Z4YMP0_RHILE|nr:alpha/beta hydrolase [Rhizobium leguminosarum]AXA42349.1 Alpha/beta hydrolase family protein [Rhizobium leguminosarum]